MTIAGDLLSPKNSTPRNESLSVSLSLAMLVVSEP
jgi:hypothetical protein